MKKIVLSLLLLAASAVAAQAQSTQELIEAYKKGTLSQNQIDQLKKEETSKNVDRTRRKSGNGDVKEGENNDDKSIVDMQRQKYMSQTDRFLQDRTEVEKLPAGGRYVYMMPDSLSSDSTKKIVYILPADTVRKPRIFGHDMFTNSQLTFEPNLSIATPDNYVLGPGDEVIVDVWGDSQMTEESTISPDGKIFISNVGPVSLAGLSVSEASLRLRSVLSTIYEGLYDGSVQMKLTLGSIRSIQVNITGEVTVSGTYTLPSLATLFHALYMAGGVNDLGTMRSVKIYRGGELFSEVDVYDYILNGNSSRDIALRDGDLITVSPYVKLVEVTGSVKRPMYYEMKAGETVADLIRFAGDFAGDANRNMVSVTRRQGGKYNSFTVNSTDFGNFVMEDGDVVSVGGSIDRYENRVSIDGAVYRPGYYAIDDNMTTVKQLIERADGLREDAFMSRAILYREKADWSLEVKSIDLGKLMSGEIADVELRANDVLVVAEESDMRENYTVSILGSVSRPDTYPYAENMTVEDLLVAAGGLLESASTANVTVTRRIKDTKSLNVSEQLFETFTVNVNDSLTVGEGDELVLEPFDQVYVRRSPVYITQSSVTVEGEVAFGGDYPLSHRNMRISEVIAAAGNVTPGAFIEGAYLLRKMTEQEQVQNQALKDMIDAQAGNSKDSLSMAGVELESVYPVGINLAEALRNPGSDADIVLRDGDVVSVPMYNGTVRVMGAVLYPNSVTFVEGKKLKHYVNAAGGFDIRARKNKAFVIYMNGMVASGKSAEIRPGCIVIVPSKTEREPISWSEVVGLISSTASTAAVIISVLNLTK